MVAHGGCHASERGGLSTGGVDDGYGLLGCHQIEVALGTVGPVTTMII